MISCEYTTEVGVTPALLTPMTMAAGGAASSPAMPAWLVFSRLPLFVIGLPRPVTYARSFSPGRARLSMLTKLPSACCTTARLVPSVITVSKIPGLTVVTGIPSTCVCPVPCRTVIDVTPTGRLAGTCTTTYSCPVMLQTA